jgi:hypothetical protein
VRYGFCAAGDETGKGASDMSTARSGRATILAVDDLPENLVALRSIFDEEPDYQVLTASSGDQALSIALRAEIDVVLLDVMMPEMDGFEVAAHLKRLERTNPPHPDPVPHRIRDRGGEDLSRVRRRCGRLHGQATRSGDGPAQGRRVRRAGAPGA